MPMARKILIVEDDIDILSLLKLRLQQHGFEVAHAMDGITAVSVARAHQPDVVLLDLGLPAGGGLTVMQRFARLPDLAAIPVIVVSAMERVRLEPEVIEAGAVAFVQKPFNFGDLLEVVDRVLAAPLAPAMPMDDGLDLESLFSAPTRADAG